MTIEPVTSVSAAAPSTSAASKARDAAQGFERQLVEQLAQQLVATTKPLTGDDDENGTDALGAYGSMLPDALSSSLEQSGGLGIADEITRAVQGR